MLLEEIKQDLKENINNYNVLSSNIFWYDMKLSREVRYSHYKLDGHFPKFNTNMKQVIKSLVEQPIYDNKQNGFINK